MSAGRIAAVGQDHTSLRDRVLDTLRGLIIDGTLAPGERLHERNLSADLAVSRVPLREAIIQLAHEGFVEVLPRRGAFVSAVTTTSVAELFDVREALEGLAAGLAAARRTDGDLAALDGFVRREHTASGSAAVAADSGFHEALVTAAHHGMLTTLMAPVEGHVRRLFHLTTGKLDIAMADDHTRMLDAIRDQDADAAARLAYEHVRGVRLATVAFLEALPRP
jgi:DNA-binding GntR family transcriptional regulator